MKALSIKQPWAGLIIAGIKIVENRSWATNYRGVIAICAGQKTDKDAMREMEKELGKLPEICNVNGAILGTVNLAALITRRDNDTILISSYVTNLASIRQWWDMSQIGFIMESPRKLVTPIPFKGQPGLFNLKPEIIARITKGAK